MFALSLCNRRWKCDSVRLTSVTIILTDIWPAVYQERKIKNKIKIKSELYIFFKWADNTKYSQLRDYVVPVSDGV